MSAIICKKLNLHYGTFHALRDVSVAMEERTITAIIGPSGCGKSTLLRVFNRMNDLIAEVHRGGEAVVLGQELALWDLLELRKRVGMVFQRPNPFPFSVYENVVYGMRIHGERRKADLDERVQKCLIDVGLFDDLKDRLKENRLSLSGEQQQRLCIARVLAVAPDILLMDEPCSALDPIATARIENLMQELKRSYSIVIVTHNMQQAARISTDCGFMLLGQMVEFGPTKQIFTAPRDKRTEDYITGRYG